MTQDTNPIEIQIGALIRQKRILRGMSQQDLAKPLALTFQQIQKYERGLNRVSTSRLMEISQIFDISVIDFITELEMRIEKDAEGQPEAAEDPWTARDTALLKRFSTFSRKVKHSAIQLVEALQKEIQPSGEGDEKI